MILLKSVCMNTEALLQRAHHFRIQLLDMIHHAGVGATGLALAYVDFFVTLYFGEMNREPFLRYNASRLDWPQRDRVILSAIHATPIYYLALAEAGFFDRSTLASFGQFGALLKAYPDMSIPGVECTLKDSGHGLEKAYSNYKSMTSNSNRLIVILEDDDLLCGKTWEMALEIAHDRLENFTAVCLHSENAKVEPISDKFKAFGWKVIPLVSGHDFSEIAHALIKAKTIRRQPSVLILPCVLGRGIPFAEHKSVYARSVFSDQEMAEAKKFL